MEERFPPPPLIRAEKLEIFKLGNQIFFKSFAREIEKGMKDAELIEAL